jgi:hypothetical protein
MTGDGLPLARSLLPCTALHGYHSNAVTHPDQLCTRSRSGAAFLGCAPPHDSYKNLPNELLFILQLQPDDLLTMMIGQSSPDRPALSSGVQNFRVRRLPASGLTSHHLFSENDHRSAVISKPRSNCTSRTGLSASTGRRSTSTRRLLQSACEQSTKTEAEEMSKSDKTMPVNFLCRNLRKLIRKCGSKVDVITGEVLANVIHVGTK